MKKTNSAENKSLTDKNIDQFCSSTEDLLKNIRSKSSKSHKNDYILDQVMFDEVTDN